MQFFTIAFFSLMTLTFTAIKLCNTLIKTEKTKIITANAVLLAASYAFIIYADYRFALAIGALTIIPWLFAKNEKLIPLGITLAVLSLGFFKYTNFFIESFTKLFGNDFTALNLIVPLGVSFYTFSAISYMADVKRGKVKAENLFYVALYLSFFPKLTSGPIQRSGDFFEQAHRVTEQSALTRSKQVYRYLYSVCLRRLCWQTDYRCLSTKSTPHRKHLAA